MINIIEKLESKLLNEYIHYNEKERIQKTRGEYFKVIAHYKAQQSGFVR